MLDGLFSPAPEMLTGATENRAIIKYGGVVYSQHRRVVATDGECRRRTTLGSHSHQILFPKIYAQAQFGWYSNPVMRAVVMAYTFNQV